MPEGRGSYQHLLKLAEKKPEVKKALENVDNMTNEDIDNLHQFQPWIRKRLKDAKLIKVKEIAGITAFELAEIMRSKSKLGHSGQYEVYQYQGDVCRDAECSVIGNSLTIEIERGDWLMKISSTSLKINATVIQMTEQQSSQIIANSKYYKTTDISKYNTEILQPYLEEKYGNNVAIMGTPVNPYSPGNFIQR